MKTVYRFDKVTGLYNGTVTLTQGDKSPRPPFEFLIPGDCLDFPPPQPNEDQVVRNVKGIWVLEDKTLPPVEDEADAPPTVPQSVSRFQARAALFEAGKLEQVETLMAAPETPMLMKLAWEDAQEFKRTSPTVAAMAAALSLTEEELDNLFISASQIQA
jgi:hypothetical protein